MTSKAKPRLRDPRRQARNFEALREAHQGEIADDYVELIADLIEVNGEARAVDLAQRMGVTAPTVTATIRRLVRDGLVQTKPYRGIFLTEEGKNRAAFSKERHRLVVLLLLALGVDRETAENDAEGLEHHFSDRSLKAIRQFLEKKKPE